MVSLMNIPSDVSSTVSEEQIAAVHVWKTYSQVQKLALTTPALNSAMDEGRNVNAAVLLDQQVRRDMVDLMKMQAVGPATQIEIECSELLAKRGLGVIFSKEALTSLAKDMARNIVIATRDDSGHGAENGPRVLAHKEQLDQLLMAFLRSKSASSFLIAVAEYQDAGAQFDHKNNRAVIEPRQDAESLGEVGLDLLRRIARGQQDPRSGDYKNISEDTFAELSKLN